MEKTEERPKCPDCGTPMWRNGYRRRKSGLRVIWYCHNCGRMRNIKVEELGEAK